MVERVLPFFGGCALSMVLVLNHTYETELVKRQLRQEIETLRKMKDFELDQVAKFREVRGGADSHVHGDPLENMGEHYHYFWACSVNALRESLFAWQLAPYLRRMSSQAVEFKDSIFGNW